MYVYVSMRMCVCESVVTCVPTCYFLKHMYLYIVIHALYICNRIMRVDMHVYTDLLNQPRHCSRFNSACKPPPRANVWSAWASSVGHLRREDGVGGERGTNEGMNEGGESLVRVSEAALKSGIRFRRPNVSCF